MDNFSTFFEDFDSMFSAVKLPDYQMHAESELMVDRYIGPGDEAFSYSVRIRPLQKIENLSDILDFEIDLTKQRSRKRFEVKTFDLYKQEAFHEVLSRKGFHLNRTSSLLVAAVDLNFNHASNLEVLRLRDDTDFEKILDIGELAFGERCEWLNTSLKNELSDPLVAIYLCKLQGLAISAGWIKFYNKIGFLFGGGTIPSHRSMGAYRSLVSARIEEAKKSGMNFVISECSPMSRAVLSGLGFKDMGNIYQWIYENPS